MRKVGMGVEPKKNQLEVLTTENAELRQRLEALIAENAELKTTQKETSGKK